MDNTIIEDELGDNLDEDLDGELGEDTNDGLDDMEPDTDDPVDGELGEEENPDGELGEEEVIEPEQSEDEKHAMLIMRHAYQKLDSLPLGFGLPVYSEDMNDEDISKYFKLDLLDTLREAGLSMEAIEPNSTDEMVIEDRVVYHALKRFRMTAVTFFKFSTATDGKTVDKTNIPKMLQQLISEYDKEFKAWKSKGAGKIWSRSSVLNYTNV